jgi:putative flavoprotein involved in K+ transport
MQATTCRIFRSRITVFSPKDKLGDWLESYTKIMELNYWTKSVAESATYDDVKKEWTVKVMRDGKLVTLRPKQVLATGMSGRPDDPRD